MRRSFILLMCCASCSLSVLSIADVELFAHDQQFPDSTHKGARTTVGRRPLPAVNKDVHSETPLESSMVRNGERTLLQSEGLDAAREPEHECSLRRVDIRRYLDASSRTWSVDDDAIDEIDSDVQSLVDCTEEGDVLLFNATKRIRPSAPVVLPWPLTLSAFVEHTELEDDAFPKAVKKATFACPRDNEGVFLVRTGGSILANLEFRDCLFGESGEKKAMIEVEGCASSPADRTLLLHHVSFKENRLVDAAGVWVHSTSCLALDMRNVEFSDNQCSSSGCGAILSSDNRIEDFTARRNRLTEEHDRQPSVLNAPTGSRTVANGIRAVRNDLSAMHVTEGSLSLTNSTCSRNSVGAFDDEKPFGACIHLIRTTATIQNSRFEGNQGYWGGSVSIQSSNVSIEDSDFRNGRAQKGGVLFAETGSAVSIERCSFTDNEAREHGGVGFIVSSSVSLIDSNMSGNSAADVGGSLRLTDSTLQIEACHFKNGSASEGGFVRMQKASANIIDSTFVEGFAEHGGCVALEERSQLVSRDLIFRSSSAHYDGGAVYALQNSSLSFINATFVSNTARESGHCIAVDTSRVFVRQSLVANNTGAGKGAFLYAANRSSADIDDSTFVHNAARFGGVIYLDMSSVGVHGSIFSGNAASQGGGSIYMHTDSNLSIHLCGFDNGTAGGNGGFVLSYNSEARISSSHFTNASGVFGGCLALSDGTNMTVENSTFSSCRVQGDGGAIHVANSTLAVENIILANNTSEDSRDGAGGVSCLSKCRMSAVNSSFEANSGIYGGAMSIAYESLATVAGCRFSGNTARHSAAAVFVDSSHVSLIHCVFTNGSAMYGGAFSISQGSRVNLSDSSISYGMSGQSGGAITISTESVLLMRNVSVENNTSLDSGGAISATDSAMHLQNSSFLGNQAMAFGGGVNMLSRSELIGDALIFDANSVRNGSGASIFSEEAYRVQISNSRFSNGIADNGGSVLLRFVEVASGFVNCSFEGNLAVSFGGACVVANSAIRFENCSMAGNKAREFGGSLVVANSTVDLGNCRFSRSSWTASGGFIWAGVNSEIRGYNVSMVEASSQMGGAVCFHDSLIQLEDAHFSSCHANISGGVIAGSENASLLCNNCIFENNTARNWGGAVFFYNVTSHPVSVQINGSTFKNNTATLGGETNHCSIYPLAMELCLGATAFFRDSEQTNCTIQDDNCSFLVVTDSVFFENEAVSAGGAVFASDIDSIRMSCSAYERWPSRSEFYDIEELMTLDAIRSVEDICQSWKGNQAGVYADDVGSSGAGVRTTVVPDGLHEAVEEVSGNRYVVEGYSSGEPLPVIQLEVVDGLGQGPAISASGQVIEAVMTFPVGFFSGSVNIKMNDGVGNVSGVVGFGRKGVYECMIDFSEELIESLAVEVHVRECRLGEVAAADGTFCEPCTSDTYNLMPGNGTGCRPCPENGDCTTHVILPAKGYWHKTPCSEHIQECLSSEACSSEKREDKLTAATRNISSCEFDEEFKQNYTEAQCREGHEGPLCGSCKASHGKSHSLLCEECFSGFGNYALIFVSFLVLMVLSYITVRSNKISTPKLKRVSIKSIRQLQSLPSGSSLVHVNEAEPQDAEVAKWKAAELFKIMVNFLQVTAIAVAINVKWTLVLVALFEGAEFISGITSETVNRSADCIVPVDASMDRSIASIIIDVCLPLGVICVFCMIWMAIKVKRGETWSCLLKKIILTVIAVLYTSYISLTKTLVSILDCVEVHDSVDLESDVTSDYWATDTKIECYKGPHALLAFILGWPFLILFSFGFPLVTACLIVTNVEEDYKSGWIYETCGFLYRSYKRSFVFWESVIMFRKAVLAVIVVFSYPLGANLQQVLAVLLFVFVLYLQMICCPYRPEFDSLNKMESASIFVSAMTFASSMFFADEKVSSSVRTLITVGIILANVTLLLFFLFLFITLAVNYLKIRLDEEGVPYNPDGGAHHILWVYFYRYLFERMKKAVHKLFFGARPASV